jgi:hypothetical protein
VVLVVATLRPVPPLTTTDGGSLYYSSEGSSLLCNELTKTCTEEQNEFKRCAMYINANIKIILHIYVRRYSGYLHRIEARYTYCK